MSYLTYQNSLTSNISPTPSTHYSYSHTWLTMMGSYQAESWTNPAQLRVTDGKLDKSYNSDSNVELGNPNMKLNGKLMNTKTIPASILKILICSYKQTTGFMVTSHTPTSSENHANPNKEYLKEKKHADEFRKKDYES